MSIGLARNWWAIGLRGVIAVAFGVAAAVMLPSSTTASLLMLFAAYVSADGFFAMVAAMRISPRTRRWWSMIVEGVTNLGLAAWVLWWPAVAVVAFLHVLSIWALVTGAFLLAAARRLSLFHGGWVLAFAGAVSAGWGILLATLGPDEHEPRALAVWLIAYAALFGLTLLVLGVHLRRRHRQWARSAPHHWQDGHVTSGARPP